MSIVAGFGDVKQRIAKLEARLAEANKKADGFFEALQFAAKINAASQAREQVLREALELARNGIQWYMDAFPEVESETDHEEVAKLDTALATPSDDTALREYGAKLLEEMAAYSQHEHREMLSARMLVDKAAELRGREMTDEWRSVKEENSSFVCGKCKSNNLKYRIPDNSGCYEDINYWCPDCNTNWWVEGSDY